jgi:membrane-associated phospholipid phosphatase
MGPAPKSSPLPPAGSVVANAKTVKNIRGLIWIYFVLLIFEGSFRKWILPQYSDVLLIIRDPVVIAIYLLAAKAKVFPRSGYILSLAIIAFLSSLASLVVLQPYLGLQPLVLVTGYGFRSNFLHLPLIFVIGRVMDEDDVKKLGRWVLLGSIPMCLLLAVQFSSSPDAFVNRTAGLGETQQITAGGGKIRPPGTFSFVSGIVFYAALSAAYLLYASLSRGLYRNWLLYAAGLALVVTIGVSGSRSVLLAVLMVLASLFALLFFRPSAVNQFARNLLIVVVVLFVAARLPVFNEGIQVLSDRFTGAAEAEDKTIAGGLADRMLGGFIEGFQLLTRAPIGGYGLGIGTNGGAKFLTGRSIFLLTEGEWGRVVLESGPILGLAFLAWRTMLTVKIGLISIRSLKQGNTLPIMLYAAGFLALLNGQFGQPTTLGFAAFLCGLCLAATNRTMDASESEGQTSQDSRPRVARRSRYAEQLHSSPATRHPDDFVNR